MAAGPDRLEAVIVTRRIAYQGGGPFVRALVEALEEQGVTVVVRRDGPYVGQHRAARDMGDDVSATLAATGDVEAINAGVGMFRGRFGDGGCLRRTGDRYGSARCAAAPIRHPGR
jgi:hypothetical protein